MDFIESFTPINIVIFISIVLYLLGGQLFSDMKSFHNQKDLSFFDDCYFRLAWPIIVLVITFKV